MENESLEVFCESIDETPNLEEDDSDAEMDGRSHDEVIDGGENMSFEDAMETWDKKLGPAQNLSENVNDSPESDDHSMHDDKSNQAGQEFFDTLGEEDDPTEILQRVMQNSQRPEHPVKEIKQEPEMEGYENENDSEHLRKSHPDDSSSGKSVRSVVKTTKSTKEYIKPLKPKTRPDHQVTRSGRKSTFTGLSKTKHQFRNPLVSKQPKKPKEASRTIDKSPSTEGSTCLVCGRPCSPTSTNEIPSFPFCTPCQKAYQSRQHLVQRIGEDNVKTRCPREGCCDVNFQTSEDWCSVCHFKKFDGSLKDMNAEYELNSKRFILRNSERGPKRQLRSNTSLTTEAVESSSAVLLERMTARELANYGIDVVNSDKDDEPASFKSIIKCHTRKRSSEPNEKGPTARKRSKINTLATSANNKPKKSKKILMEFSSDEESPPYTLPEVTEGRSAVNNSQNHYDSRCNESSTIGTDSHQREGVDFGGGNNYTEVLESIKVYVFTCGHACGLCNSAASKQWLKDSGFSTAKPILSTTHVKPQFDNSHKSSASPASTNQTPQDITLRKFQSWINSKTQAATNQKPTANISHSSITDLPPSILNRLLGGEKVQILLSDPITNKRVVTNIIKNDSCTASTNETVPSTDAQKCQNPILTVTPPTTAPTHQTAPQTPQVILGATTTTHQTAPQTPQVILGATTTTNQTAPQTPQVILGATTTTHQTAPQTPQVILGATTTTNQTAPQTPQVILDVTKPNDIGQSPRMVSILPNILHSNTVTPSVASTTKPAPDMMSKMENSVSSSSRDSQTGNGTFQSKKQKWKGVCCVAWNCSNRQKKRSAVGSSTSRRDVDITFHRFPTNFELRGEWVAAIRRQNFKPSRTSRICSEHFKKTDFTATKNRRRLREGAIPSIFNFPPRFKPRPHKANEQD